VSRSGGVAGLRAPTREIEAAPGSPAHVAAAALVTAGLDDPPTRARDAFVYRVEISGGDDAPVRATFHDPVPPAFAALLDALDAPG
jgi:hypothetical protein